jgi:class 3 adenylate cyclase
MPERSLATVLFTDIVGSTERAVSNGLPSCGTHGPD